LKTRSIFSTAIPTPVSLTETSTSFGVLRRKPFR
jgi:hypothetical protein